MNSPITNQPMKLINENITISYKGYDISINTSYYRDEYENEYQNEEQLDNDLMQIYDSYNKLTSIDDPLFI